ncbi:MAG: glycerophosphodiester phosphodiesterase [Planctomycetota bacterium]|nr:glycerophosphodiester phosphodiesterase [Planctomycetota bacterium]MDA1178443.1 glycerophosphodiester phosphodiesterase [Planctomycetota bacterium]
MNKSEMSTNAMTNPPQIIAHRGASGYLPEHTLPAKALALGMGADFLEQDIVLTQDGQPIVLHDIYLDTVTNVAASFPGRQRADGRFYALDFTLAEIQSLLVHERTDPRTGTPVFPHRFPVDQALFRIPTLSEEIEFIQGLQCSTQRKVGIYPEIKAPAWHREQGHDISRVVWDTLRHYGYEDLQNPIFVQCFDPVETRRWREEFGSRLPLIQLLPEETTAIPGTIPSLLTPTGLKNVAQYAQGIGPAIGQVMTLNGSQVEVTDLTKVAHDTGLLVHTYTVRRDSLPSFAQDHDELLDMLVVRAKVDAFFTDFPDLAFRWRANRFSPHPVRKY